MAVLLISVSMLLIAFLTSVLFDPLAPARLALRANLWLLYLKGPAFSIVVKSPRITLCAFGFQ